MLKVNSIYNVDCEKGLAKLEEGCADLIISDPPYFEIKGEFDFAFKDFADYQRFLERQAVAYKRILAKSGTLYIYGHARNIAYTQVIFDKYFSLINHIVWHKTDCQTRRNSPDQMRSYAAVKEHLLMYSNEPRGLNQKNNNADNYHEGFDVIRLYLIAEINKVGRVKVANHCGVSDRMIGHYLSKSQWIFPSEEKYLQMQKLGILKRKFSDLRKQYESIRDGGEYTDLRSGIKEKYEAFRRPFHNEGILQTDILEFRQEAEVTMKFDHPTQKPPKLSKALIKTSSRPNELVVIPFVGSGVECVVAKELGRNYVGFELDKKYFDIAEKRIKETSTTAPKENVKPKSNTQNKQPLKVEKFGFVSLT